METSQEEEKTPRKSNRDKLQSVVDNTKEKLRQIKGQVSIIIITKPLSMKYFKGFPHDGWKQSVGKTEGWNRREDIFG